MEKSQKMTNFLLSSLMFLGFLYMFKTVIGVDLIENCHAEKVLLGNCNFSEINTTIDFIIR